MTGDAPLPVLSAPPLQPWASSQPEQEWLAQAADWVLRDSHPCVSKMEAILAYREAYLSHLKEGVLS